MDRVTVYVDGFNFYYSLKRMIEADPNWKKKFYWIDFVKFFDHFIGDNQTLQKVVYFTTPPINHQKSIKQGILLRANRLMNGSRFEVILGKFYEKTLICPVCNSSYTVPEEKRTDVNISVQMLRDCALNKVDTLFLVSADSDIVPPLKLIKKDHPDKIVNVIFPPKSFSHDLNNIAKNNKGKVILLKYHKPKFQSSIMPDTITIYGKSITIPQEWNV